MTETVSTVRCVTYARGLRRHKANEAGKGKDKNRNK